MPELAEVEDRRRLAEQILLGKRICHAYIPPDPIVLDGEAAEPMAQALLGRVVQGVWRRGKHVWIEFDVAPHLLLHFGMSGVLHVYDDPRDRPSHVCLELQTDAGIYLALRMPRRIGRVRLRQEPLSEPPLNALGPEPWPRLPGASQLARALENRRGSIKGTLLDQTFLAGIGNWLADEVLYQAGIAPQRRANTLSERELANLWNCMAQVLDLAVQVRADETRFPPTWLFHRRWYKKKGTTTHDGHPLRFDVVAGRTTAWVPAVQS